MKNKLITILLSFLPIVFCFGQTSITTHFFNEPFSLDHPPSLLSKPKLKINFDNVGASSSKPVLTTRIDVPSGFSFEELGVFCKLEYNMAKDTRFPVRFRLGEFHYTEGLEGKYDY